MPDEVVELGLIVYLAAQIVYLRDASENEDLALRVARVVLNFDFYPIALSPAHLDAGRYFFSV